MRKIILLTCLFICLFVCGVFTGNQLITSALTTVTISPSRNITKMPVAIMPMNLFETFKEGITESVAPDAKMRIVYAKYGSGLIPIAIFSDQLSLAQYHDGIMGYNEPGGLTQKLDENRSYLESQTFYAYTPNDSQPVKAISYNELLQQPPIPFNGQLSIIYSNIPAQFMEDVLLENYSVETQKNVPLEYRKYLQNMLESETQTPVPALIRNIWRVDLDGDRKYEDIVRGTNYFVETDEGGTFQTNYPHEDIVRYQTLVLFSETLGIHELYKKIVSDSATVSVDDTFEDGSKPSESGYYSLFLFDSDNQTAAFRYYYLGDDYAYGSDQIIVCDINGDGLYDICTFTGSVYAAFKIFLQTEDHDFMEPLPIIFPA